MRRLLSIGLALAVWLFAAPALAQTKASAQNVPEIPYESVPNFLKMPAGVYLGEAIGVATNSKGHVFVYTRSANTQLFEFDQNGVFVREIGAGAYNFEFAHSVRVDPQDNIWVVDEGTNTQRFALPTWAQASPGPQSASRAQLEGRGVASQRSSPVLSVACSVCGEW